MLPSGLPATFIDFTHHSYARMVRVLRRTAARCSHIARTYSIGRSFDGKELLVIELSARPGQHELSKPPSRAGAPASGWGGPSFWERPRGLLGLGVHTPGSTVLIRAPGIQGTGLCLVHGVARPHTTGHAEPLSDVAGSRGTLREESGPGGGRAPGCRLCVRPGPRRVCAAPSAGSFQLRGEHYITERVKKAPFP